MSETKHNREDIIMAINWQKQTTGNYRFHDGSIRAFYGGIDGNAWWIVWTANNTLRNPRGNTETIDQARLEAEFAIISIQADRVSE